MKPCRIMTVKLISSETNSSQIYNACDTEKKKVQIIKKGEIKWSWNIQRQQKRNINRNSFSTTMNIKKKICNYTFTKKRFLWAKLLTEVSTNATINVLLSVEG